MMPGAEPTAAVWSRPAQVHWEQTQLRSSLVRLAEAHRFDLLVDRRVDPSISVTFSSSSKSLTALLYEFAASRKLGFCPVASMAYLGPPSHAASLPLLLHEQQAFWADGKKPWSAPLRKSVTLKMPFLSEPKSVLARLAKENRLTWSNLDELPHDLWNETNFPPMPLGNIFTLLLIGFDRTWTVDESTGHLQVVPFPTFDATQLEMSSPKTEISRQATTEKTASVPLANRRFTVTVKDKPLGEVLRMLAERLQLEPQIDENRLKSKGIALDDKVSVEVKNATAHEMLRRLLVPLKLDFQIKDQTLVIR